MRVTHCGVLLEGSSTKGKMMKKLVGSIMLVAVVCLSTFAWASATKRLDPGTQTCRIFNQKILWEGYEIFNGSCKSCHFSGNDKNAPFLHTESKSMKAWNRVFLEKYPQCAKDGEWDKLSKSQLLRLNDYLFRFAADSYDPYDAADCG